MEAARSDPVSYIDERLAWYHLRASRARAAFLAGRGVELAAAAAIPILALSGTPALLIAGLGALIAVVAGLEQLFRFQETWINYRQTAESLRSELFLYHTRAGPYDDVTDDTSADRLLANHAAAVLVQENTRWQAIAKRATIGDPHGGPAAIATAPPMSRARPQNAASPGPGGAAGATRRTPHGGGTT